MLSADGQSSFSASTYTQVKTLSIPKYLLHSLKGGLHTTITLGLLGYFNQTCNVTAPLLRDCREVHQSALRARLETTLRCRCRLTAQGRVALPGYSTTSAIQHPHLYINHTSTHSALIVEFNLANCFESLSSKRRSHSYRTSGLTKFPDFLHFPCIFFNVFFLN